MNPIGYLITRGLGIYVTNPAATLKSALSSYLRGLGITTNVFHSELPQNPTYPVTVFDIIDQIAQGRTHDAGVLYFREARMQLDIYAESVAEAEAAVENYYEQLGHFEGSLGVAGFTDVSIRFDTINPELDFESESILRELEVRSMDFLIFYK